MVFQEPMTSLNPALTIGKHLAEGLKLHRRLDDAEIRRRCIDMLRRVQIDDPERCLAAYRSEERSDGIECVSTGRSRLSPIHSRKHRTTKQHTQYNHNTT